MPFPFAVAKEFQCFATFAGNSLSPLQLQQQAAETAYGSAQGLTGQEQRGAQQAAREASMARGNIGGNASIASEVLNREDVLARKRAEASMAGQTAYQSAQNFYAPAQSLLSGTPAAMGYGQQYAAQGQAQLGQATPKLFDYSTAFGMDQARVKAQDAYNQAVGIQNVYTLLRSSTTREGNYITPFKNER
jgi:hypothetical protein